MACLALPDIDLPTLPSPLTIAPPALGGTLNLALCCKIVSITGSIPVPFPPQVINPPVIAFINTNLALVDAFLDAQPLKCPRE